MAARLDGGFAAVSRAFHEVKFAQFPTVSSLIHKVVFWGRILGTLHVHIFFFFLGGSLFSERNFCPKKGLEALF